MIPDDRLVEEIKAVLKHKEDFPKNALKKWKETAAFVKEGAPIGKAVR